MKFHNITKIVLMGVAMISVATFLSCRNDNYLDGHSSGRYDGEPSLRFNAKVIESVDNGAETRALTQTPFNIEAAAFPGDFYIEIWDSQMADIENPSSDQVANPRVETYFVPTGGNGGMLQYKGEIEDTPNWANIDDQHYFWSWNVPWMEKTPEPETPELEPGDGGDEEPGGDNGDDNGDNNGGGSRAEDPALDPENEDYVPSTQPITLTLQNSYVEDYDRETDTWAEGSWANGKVLETFIGATSGPYNFRSNGPEVPLQFRHLVSKISLRSMLFLGSDGSEHDEFRADIMFINMPTTFTFYPHPNRTDKDGNILPETIVEGQPENGAPVVVTDFESADPNGGIIYAFTNPPKLPETEMPWDEQSPLRDQFYICPEIDFSKVKYKITLYNVQDKYTNRGEYWGDFSSLVFQRDPGTDYDNPGDPSSDDYVDDTRILHAGEVMYFDLIVRQSGGGGTTITVANWTSRTRPASHNPHPGIYESAQAIELAGATSSNIAAKFDLYGNGYYDGAPRGEGPTSDGHMGVFTQYGDVNLGNRYTFPLDPKYIIDGNGYTMTFSPTSLTQSEITIGKMVDVYLSMNGYTIYIDPNGVIFTYNEVTGEYGETNSAIDLNAPTASWKIDIKTGKILN